MKIRRIRFKGGIVAWCGICNGYTWHEPAYRCTKCGT